MNVRYYAVALLFALLSVTIHGEELTEKSTSYVVPDYDLLELDDELRSLLDRQIKHIDNPKTRLLRLHELFYQPYTYNIYYDATGTKTAKDTFYTGNGNCISLANLFIASARYVGLKAKYQSVRLKRQWRPMNGFYEVPGHMNVVVQLPAEQATIEFNQAFVEDGRRKYKKRVISDRRARAEFYNNLGVELLDRNKLDESIAHFEKAVSIYKKLDFVWSNLGVAYKQAKKFQQAEDSYLEALKLNSNNLSAIRNIYILYNGQGDIAKAEKFKARAEKYARKNPYFLEKLASEKIDKGEYKEAAKLLRKAIRIFDLEPNFYHNLAIAYYYQDDMKRSLKALEKAQSLGESEEFKNRFQQKIDSIAKAH